MTRQRAITGTPDRADAWANDVEDSVAPPVTFEPCACFRVDLESPSPESPWAQSSWAWCRCGWLEDDHDGAASVAVAVVHPLRRRPTRVPERKAS